MKLQSIAFYGAVAVSIGIVAVFLGGIDLPEKQSNAPVKFEEKTPGFITEHIDGTMKDLKQMEVWELVNLKQKIRGLKAQLKQDFEVDVSGILEVFQW